MIQKLSCHSKQITFPEGLFQTPTRRQIIESPDDYSHLMPGAYPAMPSIIKFKQRNDSVHTPSPSRSSHIHTPTPAQRPRPWVSPTPLPPGYYPVSPSPTPPPPPRGGSLFGMYPSSPSNWSNSSLDDSFDIKVEDDD
jgi:hypothetical protein